MILFQKDNIFSLINGLFFMDFFVVYYYKFCCYFDLFKRRGFKIRFVFEFNNRYLYIYLVEFLFVLICRGKFCCRMFI